MVEKVKELYLKIPKPYSYIVSPRSLKRYLTSSIMILIAILVKILNNIEITSYTSIFIIVLIGYKIFQMVLAFIYGRIVVLADPESWSAKIENSRHFIMLCIFFISYFILI